MESLKVGHLSTFVTQDVISFCQISLQISYFVILLAQQSLNLGRTIAVELFMHIAVYLNIWVKAIFQFGME